MKFLSHDAVLTLEPQVLLPFRHKFHFILVLEFFYLMISILLHLSTIIS